MHVLNHHDGGVHHCTDRYGDPAQRHDVSANALLLHDDEGGQDADR